MTVASNALEIVKTLGNDVSPADVNESFGFNGDSIVVGTLGDLETGQILLWSADSNLGKDALFCL